MSEKQELNSFENVQVSRHAQFCITIRIAAKYRGRVKIATHTIVTTQLKVATISATNFETSGATIQCQQHHNYVRAFINSLFWLCLLQNSSLPIKMICRRKYIIIIIILAYETVRSTRN